MENGLISERFLEYIPSHCEGCGEELYFSDNLSFLACINDRCPTKVASRIEAMCKFLKIDGFGEANCMTIAKKFKLAGPAQLKVVAERFAELPDVPGWETKRNNVLQGMNKELSLWEYVKALNLPGVSGRARELIEGYENLEDFYDDLETQQVPLVAARLGIKSELDSGVLAVNTYNTMMEYKSEVLGCVEFFNIKKENKDAITLNVCITQKVPGYANKPAFIERLREIANGSVNIVQVDRVTEKTHVLVGDINSSTGKMKRAKEINEKAGQTMVYIGNSLEVEKFVSDLCKRVMGD